MYFKPIIKTFSPNILDKSVGVVKENRYEDSAPDAGVVIVIRIENPPRRQHLGVYIIYMFSCKGIQIDIHEPRVGYSARL